MQAFTEASTARTLQSGLPSASLPGSQCWAPEMGYDTQIEVHPYFSS